METENAVAKGLRRFFMPSKHSKKSKITPTLAQGLPNPYVNIYVCVYSIRISVYVVCTPSCTPIRARARGLKNARVQTPAFGCGQFRLEVSRQMGWGRGLPVCAEFRVGWRTML